MGAEAEEEWIVLLNERGERIGTAPKRASHHRDTPLHLAFSCYVFDEASRFLLTRRALTKKTWPGTWTNSFCGHLSPGEPLMEAVARRLAAELGTSATRVDVILPAVRYRAVMPNGIVENEVGPVLRVSIASELHPNPREVDSFRWVSWAALVKEVLAGRAGLSPWCELTVVQLARLGLLPWEWPTSAPEELPPALH